MKQILIVDDSTTARMCIRRCLQSAGFIDVKFYEAQTGEEALEVMQAEGVIPDLVVTDINMPVMNGEALLKRIKSSPRYTEIPVVIITSAANQSMVKRLTQIGAHAVLNKPITPASFSDVLDSVAPFSENSWG